MKIPAVSIAAFAASRRHLNEIQSCSFSTNQTDCIDLAPACFWNQTSCEATVGIVEAIEAEKAFCANYFGTDCAALTYQNDTILGKAGELRCQWIEEGAGYSSSGYEYESSSEYGSDGSGSDGSGSGYEGSSGSGSEYGSGGSGSDYGSGGSGSGSGSGYGSSEGSGSGYGSSGRTPKVVGSSQGSNYGGSEGSSHYGGSEGSSHYGGSEGSSHYGGSEGSSHYGGSEGSSHYGGSDGSSDYGGSDGTSGSGSGSGYGSGSGSDYGSSGSGYAGSGSNMNAVCIPAYNGPLCRGCECTIPKDCTAAMSCTWDVDLNSCRYATEWEQWLAKDAKCASAETEEMCDNRNNCEFDDDKQKCTTSEDLPVVCETECGECDEEQTCSDSPATCAWDGDDSECKPCNALCGACATEETCLDSRDTCLWENDSCRRLTPYELYMADKEVCDEAGSNTRLCSRLGSVCRFDRGSSLCIPKREKPVVCETSCGECAADDSCGSSPAGCGLVEDGEELTCASCSENCLACADQNGCEGSEQSCLWDSDSCRPMTPYEYWMHATETCNGFGRDFIRCSSEPDMCEYDRRAKQCQSAVEMPIVCETTCGECAADDSCGNSPAGCGLVEDGEELTCASCSEDCLACSDQNGCEGSGQSCLWDANSCRPMSSYEYWIHATETCEGFGRDFISCSGESDMCEYDRRARQCKASVMMPVVCETSCGQCEDGDSCGASPAQCGWSEGSTCVACKDDCSACATESGCSESNEYCTWDSNSCRPMTSYEYWSYTTETCGGFGRDSRGCSSEPDICEYDRRAKQCQTSVEMPVVCETTCGECDDSDACSNSPTECGWLPDSNTCTACSDSCSGCRSQSTCEGNSLYCVWEDGCRDMTGTELYELWSSIEESCIPKKGRTCTRDTACKRVGRGCGASMDKPVVCETTCGECNDDQTCNSSPAQCTWSVDTCIGV